MGIDENHFELRASEAIVFKFTNLVCEAANKSLVEFHSCRLKAVARGRAIMNINSTVHYPVDKLFLRLEMLRKANGYQPWLFNVTIDACRYLRKPYNPFVALVYASFKEFSNINHSCPYYGSVNVNGFYPRPEVFRIPLPTGDYLLNFNFFYDMKPQVIIKAYMRFEEEL
ncbi:uncharacterized protein LOC111073229 [Drosophila obscura]|uniref:uncharacterized protein LOC111073229 n=1 Tax=Drosophila obscura TaxID=7282 RepID=UPI001BB2B892|nr:uncharacterized protein LOC111073229 [Drosophila obscura]